MASLSEASELEILSHSQVGEHNQVHDCWIIVHSRVYDVSSFLGEHPGGSKIILQYAGRDATTAYDEVHAPSIIDKSLSPQQVIGIVEDTTIAAHVDTGVTSPEPEAKSLKPALSSLISLHDFEDVARRNFSLKSFAFYSSAATDLVSHKANLQCHRQLMLRPRVLRNVQTVYTKRRILGYDSNVPFFVSPAAMARMAHPDGELAIARGCANQGVIQIVSSNASYPLSDIVHAGEADQTFFLQLYVNSEREKTEALLKSAKSLGIKAVFVTVDAPIPGKREADERIAAEGVSSGLSGAVATNDKKGGGLGRVMAKYIDPTLNWDDIAWLKRTSGLPLVLKGVQTAADARMAIDYGVDGIMLSNHGGRSLDTTQPSMLTLLELHMVCPEVFDRMEVYVDGGFTRGTDILKALALGATAVGLGRPYLYALAYGQDGVEHLTEVLRDELESSMKLSGITHVDDAHPGMVNTSLLEPLIQRQDRHPWIQWRPRSRL